MKRVVLVCRVLLGVIFVFFGLNGLLQFMKMPLPPGDAGVFLGILSTHTYMTVIWLLQIVAGVLLLVGRYVPLALTILAPILVNILLFHFTLAKGGALPGIFATLLELFLVWAYRLSFRGLLDAAPEVS